MNCPLLPAWASAAARRVANGIERVRVCLGFADSRSAHHGESIAYYQHIERRDERSEGAMWL